MVHRTRVGAYVLCVRDGAVLMTRYVDTDVWTLPGGGLDHGEHPAAAAVREVDEETGYRVELGGLVGVDSVLWDDGAVHALSLIYTGTVVDGALRAEVNGSSDRAEWVPLPDRVGLRCARIVDAALVAAGHA